MSNRNTPKFFECLISDKCIKHPTYLKPQTVFMWYINLWRIYF